MQTLSVAVSGAGAGAGTGAGRAARHLFTSPPPPPLINEPLPSSPPPLPIPRRHKPPQNPALKATHNRTKYYKPLPPHPATISSSGDRSVILADSGVSYLLPDAPFPFQFSYSETPKAPPVAIREPAFLPFAPPTMSRPWTGKAPLLSKKDKERKKKVRLFEPLGGGGDVEGGRRFEVKGRELRMGRYREERSREEVLGDPLSKREVRELVKPNLSHNRQVNLGRDGLTHNMLELVHTHWRRQEVCKVRCRGVPTVDMDNVCHHLEEKTGGKIIYRNGGLVYLFRGRNYNPQTRPKYPVMLWKPAAPVYPKLIQDAPKGLTKAEADEMRKKGQNLLPICKLAKNGIYMNLVKDVRDAFEGSHLVKINCEGMHASDYKKIGAKLKELVPCVLLSFDQEQILMWRGNDWKSMYPPSSPAVSKLLTRDNSVSSDLKTPGTKTTLSRSRMMTLWKRAVDSGKAMVLDDPELSPDSILERVDEFEGISQASEHSYPALILSSEGGSDVLESRQKERPEGDDDISFSDSENYEDYDSEEDDDESGLLDEAQSAVPFGSLPVDSIAERLSHEW